MAAIKTIDSRNREVNSFYCDVYVFTSHSLFTMFSNSSSLLSYIILNDVIWLHNENKIYVNIYAYINVYNYVCHFIGIFTSNSPFSMLYFRNLSSFLDISASSSTLTQKRSQLFFLSKTKPI